MNKITSEEIRCFPPLQNSSQNVCKKVIAIAGIFLGLGAIGAGLATYFMHFNLFHSGMISPIAMWSGGGTLEIASCILGLYLIAKRSKKPQIEASTSEIQNSPIKLELLIENVRKAILTDKPWDARHYSNFIEHFCKKENISSEDLKEELLQKGKASPHWQKLVAKLTKLHKETHSFLSEEKTIEWVTGTRSSTLIGIDEVATKEFTEKKHALVPTGTLLSHNVVPLTGELGAGILNNGVNKSSLSGVVFEAFSISNEYANETSFVFDPQTEVKKIMDFNLDLPQIDRLKIAVLRLIKFPNENVDLKTLKKHIEEKILPHFPEKDLSTEWKNYAHMLGKEISSVDPISESTILKSGSVVGVGRSTGSYTWGIIVDYNSETHKYKCLINEEGITKDLGSHYLKIPNQLDIQAAQAQTLFSQEKIEQIESHISERNRMQAILSLFDTEKATALTTEQRHYVEHSFPIIWGAQNVRPRFKHVMSQYRCERAVMGKLVLGEEVSTAFTKKSTLPLLKKWIEKRDLKITVLTVSAAHYLLMVQNLLMAQQL